MNDDAARLKYLAARCWHYHGDPGAVDDSAERAREQKQRLADRTWRKGREMNRDDRKLLRRLERFERAGEKRNIAFYMQCPECSGN